MQSTESDVGVVFGRDAELPTHTVVQNHGETKSQCGARSYSGFLEIERHRGDCISFNRLRASVPMSPGCVRNPHATRAFFPPAQ